MSRFSPALSNLRDAKKTGPASNSAAPRPVGRPPGRKSDPAYVQVTVYLRRDAHDEAKRILWDADRQQFSALVDRLLADWLEQTSKIPVTSTEVRRHPRRLKERS